MYLELVGMFTMFIICINQQSKSTMTLVFMAFPLGYEPFFFGNPIEYQLILRCCGFQN